VKSDCRRKTEKKERTNIEGSCIFKRQVSDSFDENDGQGSDSQGSGK